MGTWKNASTEDLSLAKGPGKGWLNQRENFWEALLWNKKLQSITTHTSKSWVGNPGFTWTDAKWVSIVPSWMWCQRRWISSPQHEKWSGKHTGNLEFYLTLWLFTLFSGVVLQKASWRVGTFTYNPAAIRPLPQWGQWRPCRKPEVPPLLSSNEGSPVWVTKEAAGESGPLLPLGSNKGAPPCSPTLVVAEKAS